MSLISKTLRKNNELEQKKPGVNTRSMNSKVIALIGMALMIISPAAAEVNWSEITAVINGFVGIVPSFANMTSAVMPILLVIVLSTFIITVGSPASVSQSSKVISQAEPREARRQRASRERTIVFFTSSPTRGNELPGEEHPQ